jgi:hypothetical protein
LSQFGNTGGWRVFGETLRKGLRGREFDVIGGVEIRLSCSKTANVFALGLECLGLAVNGKGERGTDFLGDSCGFHNAI